MSRQVAAVAETKPCYLCGEPLRGPTNKDHIRPHFYFAPAIRKQYGLTELVTTRVHSHCNTSYQMDEEYLAYTLMPYIRKSEAGLSLYNDILAKFRRGKNVPLIRRVFAEFDSRPSGLVLPFGHRLHRRDGQRIQRVAWEIVRGLHFHRTGEVLRSDLTVACTVTTPDDDKPPDHFIAFRDLPENPVLGQYPGVFAYRFQVFPENNAQRTIGHCYCGISSS
jgi:hypothetical protein